MTTTTGTTSPATAAPASDPLSLDLEVPEPVAVVTHPRALSHVTLSPEKTADLSARASAFTADLLAIDPRSPDFAAKPDALLELGAGATRASAETSNRLLNSRMSSVAGAKSRGEAGTVQLRVATTLGDLRSTVTDLTPNRADLTPARRILGVIPGGNKIKRYFERYESAQDQLNAIIKALEAGQSELRADNGSIEEEKRLMWASLQKIGEYVYLAERIGAEVEAQIARVEAGGDVETAKALRSDALFPARQRHQDLLTQAAVAVQGYLALDLIRKNNVELIRGVDRAHTTTVSALRTAVIVAQALGNQGLVLAQIDALNDTTNGLILHTGKLLREQTAAIHEQASSSGVSPATLEQAFADVFATMDAVDTYRARATESMGTTIEALEGQLEKARPFVERSRATDGSRR